MGGTPLFALNVVGFPTKVLPLEVLGEILLGGAEIAREAGIPILGGHSTDFDVPVFGMVVNGLARVNRVRRNNTARPGDALVLTKPLGTGILTSALRARALAGLFRRGPAVFPEEETAAIASMARLNRDAARAADAFTVSASTDVTGYGLLGHLREMLAGGERGARSAEIAFEKVPLLPGAARLVAAGIAPDGSRRNLTAVRASLDVEPGMTEDELLLLADAQTSGGLLLAVPEGEAEGLVGALRSAGDVVAAAVGRVLEASPTESGRMRIRRAK